MTAPLFWSPTRRASRACIKHFVAEALERKKWASAVTPEWASGASDVSRRWVEELNRSTVHAVARRALNYCRMRSSLGLRSDGSGWAHDQPAFKLWTRLNA